ncbi:MAG: glycine cleavage T C-terminal barrel domain-containing protein, partial [Pseudomonadota bacterium]
IQALRRIKAEGPRRHQLGVAFDFDDKIGYFDRKGSIRKDGEDMGLLTATAWSPRLKTNIGMCLVSRDLKAGDEVQVVLPDGRGCPGEMRKLPFV